MKKIIFAVIISIFMSTSCIAVSIDNIKSHSAVLINADTGQLLFEKNAFDRLPPASITKLMTALLVYELSDIENDKVEVSYNAVHSIPSNASNVALQEGEIVSMKDLMHALILASANDAANAIGEHISKTTENFGYLMTKKARELLSYDTTFKNPSGLDEEGHYTTAMDMAKIAVEVYKNKDLMEILGKINYKMDSTNKQEEERLIKTYHSMLEVGKEQFYEYSTGGKTGWTTNARHTLVSFASKDDVNLIAVVMKSEKRDDKFEDTRLLFEYGFNNFRPVHFPADSIKNVISSVINEDLDQDYIPDVRLLLEKGYNAEDIVLSIADDEQTYLNFAVPSSFGVSEVSIPVEMEVIPSPKANTEDDEVGSFKLSSIIPVAGIFFVLIVSMRISSLKPRKKSYSSQRKYARKRSPMNSYRDNRKTYLNRKD